MIVEEVLPKDKITAVNLRVRRYLEKGVRVVCLLDAEERTMMVFRAGSEPVFYEGADVIPEFRCDVAGIMKTLVGRL